MRAPSAPWVSATRGLPTPSTRWPSRRSAPRVSERPPTSSRLPSRTRSSGATGRLRPDRAAASRLGQIDHGRFWASRSTGQKIAGALGGHAVRIHRRPEHDPEANRRRHQGAGVRVHGRARRGGTRSRAPSVQRCRNTRTPTQRASLRVSPVKTWSPRSLARSRR